MPVRNGLSAASGTSCDDVVPKMAFDGRPAASALAIAALASHVLPIPAGPVSSRFRPASTVLRQLGKHDRAVGHRHGLGGRRNRRWVHGRNGMPRRRSQAT